MSYLYLLFVIIRDHEILKYFKTQNSFHISYDQNQVPIQNQYFNTQIKSSHSNPTFPTCDFFPIYLFLTLFFILLKKSQIVIFI